MSNSKKVFVYRTIAKEELRNATYHILTPQFYWIKRVDMKLGDRRLLRIAPSMFETPADETRYIVLRQAEQRYVVAYLPQQIIDFFSQKGIEPPSRIWFAQKELEGIEDECVEVESKKGLARVEGVWYWLALGSGCKSAQEVLEGLEPSSEYVHLYTRRSRVLHTFLERVLVAMVVVLAGVGVALYDVKNGVDKVVAHRHEALENFGLPDTSLELRSLYSSLQKEQKKSQKIAFVYDTLSKAPWPKGVVRFVVLQDQGASITLKSEPPKDVVSYLQRYFGSVRVQKEQEGYRVEVEL
jgi:hypothetical protein